MDPTWPVQCLSCSWPRKVAAATFIQFTAGVIREGSVSTRETARPSQCRKELAGNSSAASTWEKGSQHLDPMANTLQAGQAVSVSAL